MKILPYILLLIISGCVSFKPANLSFQTTTPTETPAPQTTPTPIPSLYIRGGVGLGSIQGDTTYRIDFPGGASELAFPMANSLTALKINVGKDVPHLLTPLGNHLSFTYGLISNQTAGKMRDSDWLSDDLDILLVGQTHPELDIYSKSDAKLTGQMSDLKYTFNLFQGERFSLGLLTGYFYEHLEYDIYDAEQVGLGPYAPWFSGSIPGKVLTYEVDYSIPYAGLKSVALIENTIYLCLEGGYGWAYAEDLDDHIMRNKRSSGETTGKATLLSVSLEWECTTRWWLYFNGRWVDITTTGEQVQFWYGDDPGSAGYDDTGDYSIGIADQITSRQRIVMVGMSYRF